MCGDLAPLPRYPIFSGLSVVRDLAPPVILAFSIRCYRAQSEKYRARSLRGSLLKTATMLPPSSRLPAPLTITPTPESHRYEVVVASGGGAALSHHLTERRYSSVLAIVDEAVVPFWKGLSAPLTVPYSTVIWRGGESRKGVEGLTSLWQAFLDAELDRKSVVISVGGGAQGDMVGFAGATFKRGLSVIQVPTTLLSQVDASIGGKTAINFGAVKNLVGVIYHPSLVLVDTQSLASLPERDLCSGMAEVLKHGLIRDSEYFARAAGRSFVTLNEDERVSLIHRSLEIKAAIAAADPFERGERKLLNFGHTIGHALEALSFDEATPLTHGEAISLGMLAEARISAAMGLLDAAALPIIEEALDRQQLPTILPFPVTIEAIRGKIAEDKKNVGKEVRWTLLTGIGSAVFDTAVPDKIVVEAVKTGLIGG